MPTCAPCLPDCRHQSWARAELYSQQPAFNEGAVTLADSSVSANGAHFNGGWIYSLGGVQLFHATIAGNVADDDFGGAGSWGGVFRTTGGASIEPWNTCWQRTTRAIRRTTARAIPASQDYNYVQSADIPGSCATAAVDLRPAGLR
jgi:hypothetical protein